MRNACTLIKSMKGRVHLAVVGINGKIKIIKIYFTETGYEEVIWFSLAQDRIQV